MAKKLILLVKYIWLMLNTKEVAIITIFILISHSNIIEGLLKDQNSTQDKKTNAQNEIEFPKNSILT